MKKINLRSLHRDLGYFYIGLIVSFACSGLMMNHRESWHPEKYTTKTQAIQEQLPEESQINEKFAESLAAKYKIEDKIRRHKVKEGKFKISFEQHDLEIDMKTGKGEMVTFIKTPIVSQAMDLHTSTSKFWIYYSDIFALSLITIALTGALIIKAGKFSWKNRGWKLTLTGILFPILFLVLFS